MKEYGICYKVISIGNNKYICLPDHLVEGREEIDGFKTDDLTYKIGTSINDFNEEYIVNNIYDKTELEYIFDFNDDEDFLKDYFFEEKKDGIYIIEIKENNKIEKNEINLKVLNFKDKNAIYYMNNSVPYIILNEKSLGEISNAKSIEELKLIIEKYKNEIKKFSDLSKTKGLTKVSILNGKIDSIEVDRIVQKVEPNKDIKKPNNNPIDNNDVTYRGLKNYLKERIFGHDEEIDIIAQTLYMNYTAKEGETVESILLVGPTGTGKTETIKAACNYLSIPSVEANASNIVPQGIKGMSIEDVICDLYDQAGNDLLKAERGLIFLDEFDKLNDSDLDIKTSVKNILLTFTSGGNFPIDNNHYKFRFDSSMVNKVYAGVFDRINEKKKTVGFNSPLITESSLGTDQEIRQKIVSKHYFSLEELTRISTILGYDELDRETKKRILLDSKLSEFHKKRMRYKRQFGIELIADDTYIDAILDSIEKSETGMRSINNYVKKTLNSAERELLDLDTSKYKKLVLTKDTVTNPNSFNLY